jgi:hypothetical protein
VLQAALGEPAKLNIKRRKQPLLGARQTPSAWVMTDTSGPIPFICKFMREL